MERLMTQIKQIVLLTTFIFFGGTCAQAGQKPDAQSEMDAAIARGGRIYSDWMIELDEQAPEKGNPTYLGAKQSEREIAKSWRCVTCHGWDYKGVKPIKGVLGMAAKDPEAVIEILKDAQHGYQEFFQGDDLLDVARFISQGLLNVDELVEAQTGRAKASGDMERPFFETVCAMCHGADGQSLPGVSLGRFASHQPYLTLHTLLNGHPGAVMPSLRAFDQKVVIELLAYMQRLPENASLVSIVRGGRLYDNWFIETGRDVPMGVHPAYPRNIENDLPPKQTWLCRECHGWDYLGQAGQYEQGRHFTGIKGITAKRGADIKEILAILKDKNHQYGGVMTMQDLLDLANFVSEGQVNMDAYIDRQTKKVKSDFKKHHKFYPTLCGNCHGEKGRAIRTIKALGRVANEDPWKALHKVLNGHPAEEMPAWRSLDKEIIRDLMGYIQTLPVNKRS